LISCLIVAGENHDYEDARIQLLNSVSNFRPRETIFEIGHRGTNGRNLAAQIMRVRRSKITTKSDELLAAGEANNSEMDASGATLTKGSFRDSANYVSHFEPGNTAEEDGYSVNRPTNSFVEASRGAIMNLTGDDGVSFAPSRAKLRWDPKKKNFVNRGNDNDGSTGEKVKLIKGESGVKIPASMKSGRFIPFIQ
jgi:ATP-dependent RNA helicase DDX54/DBP10